ncbi:MAG: endopeptidase La [Candidatus Coatesbacteria bacterium]
MVEEKPPLQRYPLVPLRDVVVFPAMIVPLNVARPISMKAVESAMKGEPNRIVLVAQRDPAVDEPGPQDVYEVGCVAEILKVLKSTEKALRVGAEGLHRVRLKHFILRDGFYEVEVEPIEDAPSDDPKLAALWRAVQKQFDEYAKLSRRIPQEVVSSVTGLDAPGRFTFAVATYMPLKVEERQQILAMETVDGRLERLSTVLARELEILELERKIQNRVRKQMERSQREWYLSEQMKAIQKELGHKDDTEEEAAELRRRIKEAKMSEEAETRATKEVDRLLKMSSVSAEATVVRTYVDWLIGVPWAIRTPDQLEIRVAEKILNDDHYGLGKVKERILEFLAVRILQLRQKQEKGKSPILCFVGPPGVGKTSLGMSVARALGRKFVRVSLGGVRDEAEIRGHRRTYIGALPGKIIQGMRRAGSKNPVFLLDEVDKMSTDFRGDPSAALLEVLDPEQNKAFNDHYLEVDFDLSEVLFITTANTLYGIPYPLQDRLEILRLPGYLDIEKEKIARQFLLPKQLREHGFKSDQVRISKPGYGVMLDEYTKEAGVRNLERSIATICRKVARELVEKNGRGRGVVVTPRNIGKYLGIPPFPAGEKMGRDEVGVATGLAWTEVGGETLSIECALLKGRGGVLLTGKLGDVMKESAQAAFTYARSRAQKLGIPADFNKRLDIHIHIPEGATPKDGPSAGITMAVALISALTGRPVHRKVAMTGEITLRGNVLPIGGLKEKLLAAHRAGCKTVLIPERNEKDLEDVPKELRDVLRIVSVKHMDDVLEHALHPEDRKAKSARLKIVPHLKLPVPAPRPQASA